MLTINDLHELIPESKPGIDYLKEVVHLIPDEFALVPSTFSGKFHPPDEYDYRGLVLHTRRALQIRTRFFWDLSLEDTEKVVTALTLHDVGKLAQWTYGKQHAQWGYETFEDLPEDIRLMILRHGGRFYGRWSVPRTDLETIVHICDYWAASYIATGP